MDVFEFLEGRAGVGVRLGWVGYDRGGVGWIRGGWKGMGGVRVRAGQGRVG